MTLLPPDLRDQLVALAETAGDAIMEVYGQQDVGLETKGDGSPLTMADKASHAVLSVLDGNMDFPLISEEGAMIPYAVRKDWPAHWLVDPLDGTKEFVGRNGEFTVNIALIEAGRPVYGVVHVPVTGATYAGGKGHGSVRIDALGEHPIRVSAAHDRPVRVVVSRNHLTDTTRDYLKALGPHEAVATGSSLKMLRVAEGAADAYPRHGPTMEWDTAAAQAVIEGAGGLLVSGGAPLAYNRQDLRNPDFLACAPWFLEQHPSPVVGSA